MNPDSQYLAEKALIDATYPEDMPTSFILVRIQALDEIYLDMLERQTIQPG